MAFRKANGSVDTPAGTFVFQKNTFEPRVPNDSTTSVPRWNLYMVGECSVLERWSGVGRELTPTVRENRQRAALQRTEDGRRTKKKDPSPPSQVITVVSHWRVSELFDIGQKTLVLVKLYKTRTGY